METNSKFKFSLHEDSVFGDNWSFSNFDFLKIELIFFNSYDWHLFWCYSGESFTLHVDNFLMEYYMFIPVLVSSSSQENLTETYIFVLCLVWLAKVLTHHVVLVLLYSDIFYCFWSSCESVRKAERLVISWTGQFLCVDGSVWCCRDGQKEVLNTQCGHLLRTKSQGSLEGGFMTGLSVLDTPFLVDVWTDLTRVHT